MQALNATWVPIIYFVYPETKGLALEDVDRLFAKTDEAYRQMSVIADDFDHGQRGVDQIRDVAVAKV